MIDFQFEGGRIELEMYRAGTRIEQVARNRYAVPVTIRWQITGLDNVGAISPLDGVAVLPAATGPLGAGAPIVLAELQQLDPGARYRRELYFTARFGDPQVRPAPYTYALPYPRGKTFSVLQGFHGAFSHRGSNEYAVDFDCPVATSVTATRDGVVVAINASAQGSGTTPEYLEDRRANFVLVLHDDGTLGEYMHLAPSGAAVRPGQRVKRGQELALSGNTGFSTTPHLHFQVMTAAPDGAAKRSFPFQFGVSPNQASAPMLGQRYAAWE
jgi:murein DD-endopeptidase MepM/ murein hydrolase activator NlpD